MKPVLGRTIRPCRATAAVVGVSALLLGMASCSSSPSGPQRAKDYYVSVGDSYAVGYQPSPTPGATSGYTAVVASATHLALANFGCAGATTTSLITTPGCTSPYGPAAASGAVSYPRQSQEQAAEAFLRAHRGHVGLITVTIGGNDITSCSNRTDLVACFTAAISTIGRNVTTLASALRSAAGAHVPIIGLTYPDVLLGSWVYPPSSPNHSLATESVTVFKTYVNPALAAAYEKPNATFVDITAATGAYTPLTQTTTLAPYGTIPVAVAQVCKLTWYCTHGSIHANDDGYSFIGQQVVQAYDRSRHA